MRSIQLVVACLAVLVATAGQAQAAPVLYGAAHSGSGGASTFYTIDTTTGAATIIGAIGFEAVSGMDFAPDGTLYATGQRPGTTTNVLMTINPLTGVGTEIGVVGSAVRASSDLSFRDTDGVLFASIRDLSAIAQTMTINLATGAGTLLPNSTGFDQRGGGMAFSSSDVLYRSSLFSPTNLITVDQVSGIGTLVGAVTYVGFPATTSVSRLKAMELDSDSGIMYAIMSNAGAGSGPEFLATVNLLTAVVTHVGQTATGMDAIAFQNVAVIPEPSSLALLLIGSIGIVGFGLRRKHHAA